MNNIKTMMSSNSAEWATPDDLYKAVCQRLFDADSCDIDLACTLENQKCNMGFHQPDAVRQAEAEYFFSKSNPDDKASITKARANYLYLQQKSIDEIHTNIFEMEDQPITCWMNPPYGRELPMWMKLAWDLAHKSVNGFHHVKVACLVPARTDTNWWWKYCAPSHVTFLKGRVKFGGAETGAPFPSAVILMSRLYDATTQYCQLGARGLTDDACSYKEWIGESDR